MNEKAILASYNLAVQNGYKKSIDEFKKLLSSNSRALDVSYNLALQNGYKKTVDDYKVLMGLGEEPLTAQEPIVQEVKKKDTTELPSGDGSSASSASADDLSSLAVEVQDKSILTKRPRESKPIIPSESTKVVSPRIPQTEPQPDEIDRKLEEIQQVEINKKTEEQKSSKELENNPIISFGKKFWETLSKQIPSAMEAKGAQTQSQFVESDMRRLKSIADVSDDDIIEMPSLTDPRGGNLTSYKAGEYKKLLAEKIARGNKAMQASIELALKLNKDLSNSDVISSLTQVNDGYDLLNFISSSIGQTVAQVPLSLATGGGMSYAMESGNIYLETVKEIAEKEGITPVQVIQQGKDQAALAEIGGAISGALDLFGATKILSAFGLDNIKKDLRKRALTILVNSQVEGVTEVGQELVSSAAKGIGVQGELKAPTLTQALDAYAAGMFGAAGVQSPSLLIGSKKDVSEEIVQPVILDYGDSKFGFIRDESGRMEMTKELDNEEQAISMSNMLSKAYKGLQFTIEEIQPTDPYKPTKYKIVANEIATPVVETTPSLTEELAQSIAAQETKPTQQASVQNQESGQVKTETKEDAAKRKARIIELGDLLDSDFMTLQETGQGNLSLEQRQEIKQELLKLNSEEDAVQEQAAGQVPVQPTAAVGQEVEQGIPQTGPQVTSEASVQEEVTTKIPEPKTTATFADELSAKYGVELELQDNETDNSISVPKIVVPKDQRKTGIGTKVMEEIIEFADSSGKRLILTPSTSFGGSSVKRLVEFYKSLGFVENKGKNKDFTIRDSMYRNPVPVAQEAAVVSPAVSPLTQEQQMASMEQMFSEEKIPDTTANQGVSVTNKSAVDNIKTKTTDKQRVKVIESAQRVLKTLKSVLPNFDIVLHDEEGSFNAAMDEIGGAKNSRGNFSIYKDGSGRIDINLSRANSSTVSHEVAHAIMAKAFNGTPELYKSFRDRISKVLNESTNKKLMEFSENYNEDASYEEYLAELTAILEQEEATLSVNTLQKIAVIINDVVLKLTNGKFKPFQDIKDTKQLVDFFNSISSSIRQGEDIELNGGGEVGTFNFGLKSRVDVKDAPSVANDSRSFIKDLVKDVDIKEFSGKKFVTNMYDYTNAGITELGNGFTINMLGGKNYVPYMMSLQDKKIGDVSNLAAFNNKAQAESFARNAIQGKASLFAPHSGTLSESWQFQQHTFAELVNLIIDKNIMSDSELIDVFNKTISSNKDNKKAFDAFKTKAGKDISNFDSFKNNPKKIVELLDIKNNYSTDLRKALNNAISADKTFQKAIGIKNKEEFFNKIMDPLNQGVQGGEIINVVEFDPNTFQIVQTKASAIDHHPSFGWSILAKINGIYQPTQFYNSSSVTDSYVKYNKSGEEVSRKAEESNFEKKNVSSSAGSIPKVAEFNEPLEKEMPMSKAQLIGENANLSARVKFNLNLAKAMETTNMTPRDIRFSTGWEKGKDKKWRYEILDGKFKDIDLNDLKKELDIQNNDAESRVAILGDVFSAPDLYAAYPEAKNIKVVFKDLGTNNFGGFTPSENKILINKNYYNTDIEAATLTTLHEIQHYIQTVEVFEPGQAPSTTRKIFDSIINVIKYDVNETKKILKEVEDKFFVNKDAVKKAREAYKLAYGNYKLIKDLGTSKEVNNKREYIKRLYGKNLDLTSDSDFNLYLRAAGEVEARNVEVRNALTPEQRKRTLLFETEDVRREDQVLFNNYSLMLEQNLNEIKNEFKGKAQLDTDSKAKKVVQQARAQGFSEDVIRLFLQGKGISEADINKAMETDIPAAGRITLSEETISGYDSLMKKLENLIVNGMPLAEVISKLKNSKTYIDATDVQKEKLVREVRKMGGVKEKSAPRAGRLIGIINDITKITMTEKEVLNKRIKDLAEGAKDAVKGWRKITSDLAKEIKALAKDKSGKLTARQVTSVTTRLAKLNAFNEQSVKDFIDYMAKVFADAEYRDTIDGLRGKIAKAKKNITSKIGIANTLRGSLNKLLSINPLLIPDAYLDRYVELVEMLGANQQVLELEQYDVVKSDTEAILRAVDEEQSKAYELADVLENSDNKVYTKSGELDYAATLKKMVKEGEITEEDADLMRKYKKEIVPQDERQKLSEEEIKEKKEEAIKAIKAAEIKGIDGLPSQEEKAFAEKFAELIKNVSAENLMKLGLNDLRNLSKVIDNINKNYLPSFAYQVYLKIDGINDGEIIEDATSNVSLPKISTAIGKIKNLVTKEGALYEAVKRIPLFFIDQAVGLKDKKIFNALLLKTAQAEAKYKAQLKRINSALEKAEQKVASSFSFNEEKLALSKMKMMTYLRQLEFESNQGNEQVNPALDYINKTIEHIDKQKATKKYGKTDLDNLKYIRAMFQTDGQINLEKLYNSFNQAEKDAISDIQKINESLRTKAEFTSNVMRGQVFNGLNNYLHVIVLGDGKKGDIKSATDITNRADNNMKPSTKAKSLEERTKGAKAINFDVFASASRGAKYVLLDYNLTGPIKTARIALNQLEKTLDERKNVNKVQREVSNTLTKAYEEAVDNLLVNNIMDDTTTDIIVEYIKRMGYRSVLAGTGRFTAELTSNISFAILAEPQAFMLGTKYANIIMSPLGPSVLENLNSTQINRIFPEDSLSGNFMDTSAMKQKVGGGKLSDSRVINKIQQGWNLTGKRWTNAVEVLSDNLISTPDKIVIRALWFGSFAQEFKKVSGKDVDFKLIGENNKEYLKENKEAIDKATEIADRISVQAGATDNTFMGILKGASRPNQTIPTKIYNNFNSYMTRFLIFEFMSARTGVYAMMGDGPMSRTKGAMLLGAVATRMTVYSMLSKMLTGGIIELAAPLFGIEDEEEEDDKTLLQSLGQAFIGTVGSLFFGRDFGNAVKMFVNFGLEKFNEEYLDFLREGEYDQYEDAIAYSIIPQGKEDKQSIDDMLFKLGGSFGPAAQTGRLVGENILSGSIQAVLSGGTTKKEAVAIERERRVVTQRIPLEILGNAGFIPLYKDIRTVVNKSIYADLKNTKVKTEATKAIESPASLMEKRENLEDLRAVKDITIDEEQLKVIRRKIIQINGTDEQKDSVATYNKRKEEQKKILLYDSDNGVRYDNETEMERYNKRLYIKRFGRGSEWNEKYKAEDAVRKKLTRITRQREDEEYGYKKKN